MTRMLMLFLLSAVTAQAAIIHRDYSASPKNAETALANTVGAETKTLYISTNGAVTTSNPAGYDVFIQATRSRERQAILQANNIAEYVNLDGSTTDGFHENYLTAGTEINSGLGFNAGYLLYRFDANNPGNTFESAGPGYLGFRISAGSPGSYYYGWARVSGFIKTENATYDLNQASVTITEVGIMDVPDVFIEAGQTYIPTPGMLVLGTNSTVVANSNTTSLADGTEFYPVAVGKHTVQTFSITNNGSDVLSLSGAELSDATHFNVADFPVNVDIGAVSNFTVTFSPSGVDSYTATLSISNNTPSTNYVLNLEGTGYHISPNNGPYGGGNTVTISNNYSGTITNIQVDGISVAPAGSGSNWFMIVMPTAANAGPVDITVQSTGNEWLLPGAYTYNSRGRIFERIPDWGTWEQVAGMPYTMRFNEAAVLGDSIYSVAGSRSQGASTNVLRFNGVSWSEVKGLPGGRLTENHTVAAYDGKIYSCGGYVVSNTIGALSREVWIYDGTNWSQGPDLPDECWKGSSVVYSNRLIVTEGYYGQDVFSFDGTNWTTLAPLPRRPVNPAVAVLGGHLYVMGGDNASGTPVAQTNVFRYNGTDWTEIIGLPDAMKTPAAAVMDSSIYLLGQTNNNAWPALFRFDGESWTNAPGHLPVVRQEHSLLYFSNHLYMVAGNGYPPTDTNVYRYIPATLDVSGVSPSSGSITGGYEVVIVGTNLCSAGGDVTHVTLHDVDVMQVVSASPTQIVVVAGFGAATNIGVGDARVFSTSIGETYEVDGFEYIPEQWITNFIPTNGSVFLSSDSVGMSAQAFSELPVSFSVISGPGSITGGTNLSFSSSGVVAVVASQAGDGTWPAAPSVTNRYTVYPIPVVGPITVWRATNNVNLKIPDVQLLTNSVCPAGTTLSVVWASASSTNGGNVAVEGRWTTYEPPASNDSPDFFQFLVRNGYGGEAVGTAEVLVFVPQPGEALNLDTVIPSASNTVIRFVGIPGRTFDVQVSTSLVNGTWQNTGSLQFNQWGYAVFTNHGTPAPSQYFRTVQPLE